MLKTNSKEVKQKIESKIVSDFDSWLEDNFYYLENAESMKEILYNYYFGAKKDKKLNYNNIKEIILVDMLTSQYIGNIKRFDFNTLNNSIRYYGNYQKMVYNWFEGLPSILNCDFLYHCKAKEIVKDLLEETEEEADKYTEEEAQELYKYLLFRELTTNINIYNIFN